MDDKSRKILGKALRESTLAYIDNNGHMQCVLTQEWDMAHEICQTLNIVIRVIRSDEMLFSAEVNRRTGQRYFHSTNLGELVQVRLKADISAIKHHFPMHRLNPLIELFIKEAEKRKLYQISSLMYPLAENEVIQHVNILNDFINAIRMEGKKTHFTNSLSEFNRLANKNSQALIEYINAIFSVYASLLVIRLDLGYLKKHSWPCDAKSAVAYNEAKKHWEKLLKYLRTKLPHDCLAGFAYKLEYGLEKGFHYHILIMLDGSKVRGDITIAKLIGEYWKTAITDNKGIYYDCNAFKGSYKSCGIGVINHDDFALREGLEKAALYLTKTDYFIKMMAPENGRTFGKGNKPKPKGSLGRPRRKAEQILLAS